MAIPAFNKEQARINRDLTCDKIPLVSTATNLIDLFQKVHYRNRPDAAQGEIKYSAYIQKKSAGRCVLLMIPILGNIIIAIREHRKAKKAAELLKAAQELNPANNERVGNKELMEKNLKEAADLGSEEAKKELEKLSQPVEVIPKINDADAQYAEGQKLYGEKKFKEAFACFEKAGKAETSPLNGNRYISKHHAASFMLAKMYAKGQGVALNLNKVTEIRQALGNSGYGRYLSGFIAENGLNGKKQYLVAQAHYSSAVRAGVAEAKKDLDRLNAKIAKAKRVKK